MFLRCCCVLAIGLMLVALPACAGGTNQLPPEASAILNNADSFELLSLDPTRGDKKPTVAFHGYKVLGKTLIKDKKTQQRLLKALQKGIDANDGTVAGCFNPRHGIRAVSKKKKVELVICFQCYSMSVYVGKEQFSTLTTSLPAPVFNKVLQEARVPLPKQPKD